MIVRLDITAGLAERNLTTPCILLMVLGETLHIVKEMLLELTLGWQPLTTRVLVVKITDEFILRPDVLWVHDASVDLWAQWFIPPYEGQQ
jgi:hypothetical protein